MSHATSQSTHAPSGAGEVEQPSSPAIGHRGPADAAHARQATEQFANRGAEAAPAIRRFFASAVASSPLGKLVGEDLPSSFAPASATVTIKGVSYVVDDYVPRENKYADRSARMDSLRKLYKQGRGPSSSHTMGPSYAAQDFASRVEKRLPGILEAEEKALPGSSFSDVTYTVTLYGSLAQTGKGHLTDAAILEVLGRSRTTIVWEKEKQFSRHPNGLLFVAHLPARAGEGEGAAATTTAAAPTVAVYAHVYYSIGGGALEDGKLADLDFLVTTDKQPAKYTGCPLEDSLWARSNSQVFLEQQLHSAQTAPADAPAEAISLAGATEDPAPAKASPGGGDSPYKAFSSFRSVVDYCRTHQLDLAEFVFAMEGPELQDYLLGIWNAMRSAVAHGLAKTHNVEAAGDLNYPRKAYIYNSRALEIEETILRAGGADGGDRGENRMDAASRRRLESLTKRLLIQAYALAVSEENGSASGDIVTAPTCGACGVVPGLFYYYQREFGFSDADMVSALAVAGIVGNIAKCYGSISGAEAGCQAEVGVATSMAAAGVVHLLFKLDNVDPHDCLGRYLSSVEFAALTALEHQLGLTCDPVRGLVVVPCIERNGFAALRADDCAETGYQGVYEGLLSYDEVVETMVVTGRALPMEYRESAKGGLAKTYCMDETDGGIRALIEKEAKELTEGAEEPDKESDVAPIEEEARVPA